MCGFFQNDRPPHVQISQTSIQVSQRAFGVVPAPAFQYGYVNIFRTEMVDQINYGLIPMRSQDMLIVPMRTGDEDLLSARGVADIVVERRSSVDEEAGLR
jgi:hypothetical protein